VTVSHPRGQHLQPKATLHTTEEWIGCERQAHMRAVHVCEHQSERIRGNAIGRTPHTLSMVERERAMRGVHQIDTREKCASSKWAGQSHKTTNPP
jgi:hypothetical protein